MAAQYSGVPTKRARVPDIAQDPAGTKRLKRPSFKKQVEEIKEQNQKVATSNQLILKPILKEWLKYKFGVQSFTEVMLVNFDHDEQKTIFEAVELGRAIPIAIIQKLAEPEKVTLAANGRGFTQEFNLLPGVFSISTVKSINEVLAAHVPKNQSEHPNLRYILGAALSLTRFVDPDKRLKFVRELLEQGQVPVKLNRCGSIRSICADLAAHPLN
jgi:hypothetical protein